MPIVGIRGYSDRLLADRRYEALELDRSGALASFRSLVAQGRRRAIAGSILLEDGIADVVGWPPLPRYAK